MAGTQADSSSRRPIDFMFTLLCISTRGKYLWNKKPVKSPSHLHHVRCERPQLRFYAVLREEGQRFRQGMRPAGWGHTWWTLICSPKVRTAVWISGTLSCARPAPSWEPDIDERRL